MMSEDKNTWIDAVAKLIQLTQDGVLKWDATKPADTLKTQSDDSIDIVFLTTYKGKRLRLYKRTYTDYRPAKLSLAAQISRMGTLGAATEMEAYRETEFIMDLSSDGPARWSFPKVGPLRDLYSAVQYQVAGVKEFLSDLLS